MRWLHGELVEGDSPTRHHDGVGLFETMAAVAGDLPLWPRHLARLQAGALRLGLPFAEAPSLRAAAVGLLQHNGHHDGVLRLGLLPDGRVELCSRSRAHAPAVVKLIPTVARRAAEAPPADLKATPRSFYDAVLHEAQLGGADDGIVLGDDGAVLETALGNLWLGIDGVWVTPALDGRVLPGIARALLLERARPAGLAVSERRCDLADLHRADSVLVSNAVHGPRPVVLCVGRGTAVENFDTTLQVLWRRCMGG